MCVLGLSTLTFCFAHALANTPARIRGLWVACCNHFTLFLSIHWYVILHIHRKKELFCISNFPLVKRVLHVLGIAPSLSFSHSFDIYWQGFFLVFFSLLVLLFRNMYGRVITEINISKGPRILCTLQFFIGVRMHAYTASLQHNTQMEGTSHIISVALTYITLTKSCMYHMYKICGRRASPHILLMPTLQTSTTMRDILGN